MNTHLSPVSLTAVLWLAFVGYWFLAARRTKRTVATGQSLRARLMAKAFMALGPALYYLPLSRFPVLGVRRLPGSFMVDVTGLCLMIAGLAFAVWSRAALADNWSGAVTLKQDHALITSGAYAIVRHPIYGGVLTAMLGTAIVIGEARAFLPLIGVLGLWQKMNAEEDLLRAAFPAEYAAYEKRVPRRLIPGVL